MFAERLKKSLLQAAIQGKLTEQLPTDGDARDLLRKIRAEKAKLIADKKIKAEKSLPPVTDEEIPFDLPANWCWCRLGEIGNYKKGPFGSSLTKDIFVPKGNDAIKVYEQKNAIQKDASLGKYYISKKYFFSKMSGFEVKPGDIIISCAGTIGESYVMPLDMEKGIINQALMRMKIFAPMNVRYFLIFFDFVLKQNAKLNSKGSAIKNIPPLDVLKNFLVPLSPLAEQNRIVERLDALLSEVDELAKDERELVELEENFPRRMKNSLLQAAIQGKLTEQLPSDGDARDLLRKIRAEKAKLLAEKKIKSEKLLPPITDDEIPFDLPDNWCWCRLGDVCNYGTNETISPAAMKQGKLLVDLEDIEKNSGKLINRKFFDGTNANSSKNIFHRGQVLFGKLRVYLNKVIVADDDGYCSSEILPLDFWENILNQYAQIVLMSSMFINYATACSYGTKMPRLGTKAGQLALFPLPPLTEQKRIVERLNELLPLCEL